MNSKNKDYLNEYLYDYLEDLNETSNKYKELSGNLKDRLSELFDSIEDEDCDEILCDIDEINKFLIKLNSLSNNEFTMIKDNGKILIDKHIKHKEKIMSLKTKNKMLEEELSMANEQKEKILLKLDELSDEYNNLYQEKHNLELNISLKENEETEKHKINNEILNDEIKLLNDKIDYLNKQIKSSEEKLRKMSEKNYENLDNISRLKKELECKDELIKITVEKYRTLNEEKENIRSINRGLQKTIEDLKNQCKDYQTIISYKEEQEKINKNKQQNSEKFISLNSLIENEEDSHNNNESKKENENENENNKNINIDEIQNNRKNTGDYNGAGKEINLNELIFEESDSGAEQEVVEKKNQIKLALTRVKAVRRFNKLKSLNYNIKNLNFGENYNRHLFPKKTVIHKNNKSNKSLKDFNKSNSERFNNYSNKKLDYFGDDKYLNNGEENKNDEIFVYDLLYRLIDF